MTELLLTNSRHCFCAVNVWPCSCLPLGFFFFLSDSFLHFCFVFALCYVPQWRHLSLVLSPGGALFLGAFPYVVARSRLWRSTLGFRAAGFARASSLSVVSTLITTIEKHVFRFLPCFFFYFVFFVRPGNDERGVPFSQFGASSELDRLAANASLPVGMSPQSTW